MSKSHVFNRLIVAGSLLALGTMASGCSSLDRLAAIGEKPKLSAIDNPTTQAGYKPVSMPMTSFSTLATGDRQLVVHEAFDRTMWSLVILSWLTP